MELFKVENLTFSYPQQKKKALDEVTFNIQSGEFVVVCGKSGCGKSTLLRHFKTALTPFGLRRGMVSFKDRTLDKLDQRIQSEKIGFVLQNPDNQIVTEKVWHELAFGLESLGRDNNTIRLRVAEMASFFGIEHWFIKDVAELSGGQKQLLCLAGVMAMSPDVLILDEPTAQLDPIAAGDFLETVKKINSELGVTVIMTEHRLEEVLPMADRVLVLDQGRLLLDSTPVRAGQELKMAGHDMFVSMPTPMQIYVGVDNNKNCPVTVKQGRLWLDDMVGENPGYRMVDTFPLIKSDAVVDIKNVWFRYEKNEPDVIKHLDFTLQKGTLHAVLGGNGTGKTTMLSLICGLYKPTRGKIKIKEGNVAMLPQNSQALFVEKTVERDLFEMVQDLLPTERTKRVGDVARLVGIEDLLESHPYDLSGGEQQRAALAKVLLLSPKILLLDEPTKGMDNHFKNKLAHILQKLTKAGTAVLMVSHDVEFCAKYADLCSLFFDGSIVTTDRTRPFFMGNTFYTTAANRMSRHLFENAVTAEDVITLCEKNTKKR